MTGMTVESEPEVRDDGVRRWLVAILGLQVLFALILFGADLARVLPATLWPSPAPGMDLPVAPGDQTRRFTPDALPARAPRPGTSPLPAREDMPSRLEFTQDDAETLTLTGTIAPGDAGRFADWLATRSDTPGVVRLNSPGGSVADALTIGRALRAMGAATEMTATDICLSACPYILAGGAIRRVADGAWVGVHQHFFGENIALPAFLAVEDIQRGQGEVMAYLIEMDVDPALMQPALVTPPDEIYLLLPEELVQYRLVSPPA